MGLMDEGTDDAAGSQASSIKLKQLITNNGELNGIFRSRKISTTNKLSIIVMANSTKIKGFDSATSERFVVHLLKYTTQEVEIEFDCFTKIDIDTTLDELLATPAAWTLMANLSAR